MTAGRQPRASGWARGTRVLVLVLLGVVVGLAVAEGGARITERIWCRNQFLGIGRRSATYGWGHRPGASGWIQSCPEGIFEWRTYVRFDRGGLRSDRDVPHARSDAIRVLVLGDSFTEGLQVAREATWVHLVEARLAASAPPGTRYEFLNAGNSAWGTDNALLWYLAEGRRYRPDVVLLAFDTSNDVFENARALVGTNPSWPDKPYFAFEGNRLVRRNFPLPPESRRGAAVRATLGWLVLRSALMRRVAELEVVKKRLVLPPPPIRFGVVPVHPLEGYLRDQGPAWREAWRITRGLVLRLRAEVEVRGSRFVVAVVNGRGEVSPALWPWLTERLPFKDEPADLDRPNRLITGFLARRGIPFVSTLEAFRERYGRKIEPGFYGYDVHWAPPGHALAAEVIAAGLHRSSVLPSRPVASVRE